MKNRFKVMIKTNYPRFYDVLCRSYVSLKRVMEIPTHGLEWARYRIICMKNRPYFGPILVATRPGCRAAPMKQCIEMEVRNFDEDGFKVLEVGSWAGGSALLWGEAIRKFKNGKGVVVCVDAWEPYFKAENIGFSRTPARLEKALKKERIYRLFLHNIRAARYEKIIRPFKGYSDQLLPVMRENEFNFVYVDGSHFYSQVIRDLKNCAKLVCEGGILCGDDLELQKHEIDLQNAITHKEKDYIIDTRQNKPFHPGVTLSVHEFFGNKVSVFDGFWAMRKTKSGWQKVELI